MAVVHNLRHPPTDLKGKITNKPTLARKLLATVLALLLMFSLVPFSALFATDGTEEFIKEITEVNDSEPKGDVRISGSISYGNDTVNFNAWTNILIPAEEESANNGPMGIAPAMGIMPFAAGVTYEGTGLNQFIDSRNYQFRTDPTAPWENYDERPVGPNTQFRGYFEWSMKAGGAQLHAGDVFKVALGELPPAVLQKFAELGEMPFGQIGPDTYIGSYRFVGNFLIATFNENIEGLFIEDGGFEWAFWLRLDQTEEDQYLEFRIGHLIIPVYVQGTNPGSGWGNGGGGGVTKTSVAEFEDGALARDDQGRVISSITLTINENNSNQSALTGFTDQASISDGFTITFDPSSFTVAYYDPSANDSMPYAVAKTQPGISAFITTIDPSSLITISPDGTGFHVDFAAVGGAKDYTWIFTYKTLTGSSTGLDLSDAEFTHDGVTLLGYNSVVTDGGLKIAGAITMIVEDVSSNVWVRISPTRGAIVLFKTDLAGASRLNGAVFELCAIDVSGAVLSVLATKTTGSIFYGGSTQQGAIVFDNLAALPSGQRYMVREISAPSGYAFEFSDTIVEGFALNKITEVTVTNAPGTSITITGTKTIDNPVPNATFTIQVLDGPDCTTANVLGTATVPGNGGPWSITVPNLMARSAPYALYVVESIGSITGVTFDSTVYAVTFYVNDNGNGSASYTPPVISVVGGAEVTSIEFTNSYVQPRGNVTIDWEKQISGISSTSRQVTIELYQNDVLIKDVVVTGTGSGSFAINDLLPGNYQFVVKEKTTPNAMWADSTVIHTVTSVITDHGGYTSTATTYDSGNTKALFVNTYNAPTIDVRVDFNKLVEGWPGFDGYFDFELTDMAGNVVGVAQIQGEGPGSIWIYGLTPSASAYHYQLRETTPAGPGWTHSNIVLDTYVTVTDSFAGTASYSIVYEHLGLEAPPTFVDSYQPASVTVTLSGIKVGEGRALIGGFIIDVFQLDDDGNIIATVATGTTDAAGNVVYNPVFLSYDTPGVFNYVQIERASISPGWTSDPDPKPLTVTVADNGQGQLVADVVGNNPEFTNLYTPGVSSAEVIFKKTVVNWPGYSGTFDFELRKLDGTVVGYGQTTGDGFGSITINNLTPKDEPHHYKLVETTQSGNGWICSEDEFDVFVTVTDNGNATNTISMVYMLDGQVITPEFVNTYSPNPASFTVTANKVGIGGNLPPGFRYNIHEGDTLIATGVSDADGKITFTPDTFTYYTTGNHTLIITEEVSTIPGWGHDPSAKIVIVYVTDNEQGNLIANDTGNGPTFTNVYSTTGTSYTFRATKVGIGGTLKPGHVIKAFNKDDGALVSTGITDAAGNVVFTPAVVFFDTAGTREYVMLEEDSIFPGWVSDPVLKFITVPVIDNGMGQLVLGEVLGDNPEFTNVYNPGTADVQFVIKKNFTGKGAPTNLTFSFVSKSDELGNKQISRIGSGEVILTLTGLEGGKEYSGTISEIDSKRPGVNYDNAVYDYHIFMRDDGNGTPTPEVTVKLNGAIVDNIVFNNTYRQPTADLKLYIYKDIKGISSTKRVSRIVVVPDWDKSLSQTIYITGAGIGSASFYGLTPGTYTGTAYEDNDPATGWTDDPSSFRWKFIIEDIDGNAEVVEFIPMHNGQIVGSMTFTNTFKTSANPPPPGNKPGWGYLPKTGDTTTTIPWLPLVGAVVIIAGVGVIIATTRRKKETSPFSG